jgi:hypothetical protein
VHENHSVGKNDNKGSADENNKIRGKKCHDKRKRIFETVSGDQQLNAEYQEEGSQQNQGNLPYPPE